MHHTEILWNPRFTHQLVRDRAFAGNEVILVDVGMRGGIQQHWVVLRDQLRVVGFEPDEAECRKLNEATTEWKQVCYPAALDSSERTRKLFLRSHNRAADGIYPSTWWSDRIGIMSADEARKILTSGLTFHEPGAGDSIEIQTTTYAEVAKRERLARADFMKVDVEGGELDVLRGAEPFLTSNEIIGVEVEVRFIPFSAGPLFLDVYAYMAQRGYFLFSMSAFRNSRKALPMPCAWDHRDHQGNQIMGGPTTRGQLSYGDVVFVRDLISDGFQVHRDDRDAILRVLKAASFFEIYNSPDCAAELLLYYRDPLSTVVNIDDLLAQLVPEGFDHPVRYVEYIEMYNQRLGRFEDDLDVLRENARLHARIFALENSTSWKITRPLRWLKSLGR